MTDTKTPILPKIASHVQAFQNVLEEMKQVRGKERIGKQQVKSRKNFKNIMS
jgi:hypothetical protein